MVMWKMFSILKSCADFDEFVFEGGAVEVQMRWGRVELDPSSERKVLEEEDQLPCLPMAAKRCLLVPAG